MIAGLLGGVASFLIGWILYGFVFKSTMAGMEGMAGVTKPDEEMIMWALVVGNLSLGMMYAYIFGTWTNISTFMGGLRAGAIISFFMGLGWDMVGYATSNAFTLNGALMDVAICVVMGGIVGGVVAWWLGRN